MEPEYIEREAAMRAARHAWGEGLEPSQYIEIIPAADVAPVVRGEWEAVDWREYDAKSYEVVCYPEEGIACTRCRNVFKKDALWKKNFCPNCGARMDGGACNQVCKYNTPDRGCIAKTIGARCDLENAAGKRGGGEAG